MSDDDRTEAPTPDLATINQAREALGLGPVNEAEATAWLIALKTGESAEVTTDEHRPRKDRKRPVMAEQLAHMPLLPPQLLGESFWAMREDDIAEVFRTAAQFPEMAFDAFGGGYGDIDVQGGVAIIPLSGMITPRASFLSMLFGGGGGLEGFRCAFRDAINSSEVKKIVLDIDSPGGLVSLVPETAAEVFAARGTKPIVACVNTLAASAAYWIAAMADQIVCTPSGMAGSIGVYKVHVDRSGRNELMGVDPSYISAGKFKTEGNPDEALSKEARSHFQQSVDDLYGMFVAGVAEGRGATPQAVINGYGEGRCLLAERALEANLIDEIGTLADVVGAPVEDERPEDEMDDDEPDEAATQEALTERRREHARLLLGV